MRKREVLAPPPVSLHVDLPPKDSCTKDDFKSGEQKLLTEIAGIDWKQQNFAIPEAITKDLVRLAKEHGTDIVTQQILKTLLRQRAYVFGNLRSASVFFHLLRFFRENEQIDETIERELSKWVSNQYHHQKQKKQKVGISQPVSERPRDDSGDASAPFFDILLWWSKQIQNIALTQAEELEFVISLHLNQFCADSRDTARWTLVELLPRVSEQINTMSKVIFNAFVRTICSCASALPSEEFFHLM